MVARHWRGIKSKVKAVGIDFFEMYSWYKNDWVK